LNPRSPQPILAAWPRYRNHRRSQVGDIYKIATIWLGTVEALDKQAAVEKAAQQFKADVWRLYAVARR
jgi:hypothetical protein